MLTESAFASSPRERCDLITIVIDIFASTHMKMSLPEGAWLDQMLLFTNVVSDAVERHLPLAIMKSNGDGLLIFMPSSDDTLEAIQLAIDVQEALSEANLRVDGAMGVSDLSVSIAITTGTALRVEIQGRPDFWGFTVDKAARLCAAASPNGIFIDPATVAATNVRRVHAKIGEVLRREPDEYIGPREQINVKGVAAAVEYHEVLWGRQRFGVRSDFVTKITAEDSTARRTTVASTQKQARERRVGRVKTYNVEKGFGFIATDEGEDFFVALGLLVYPEDVDQLKPGVVVVFNAIEATEAGRLRRAAAVLVNGTMAEGILVTAPGVHPFGFIRVRHPEGYAVDVFAATSELPNPITVGDDLDFRVEISSKGAKAVEIKRADGIAAA